MKEELDTKSVQIATKVIIHAGNARTLVNDAINSAFAGEVGLAETKLEQANEEIRSAHLTQTEVIQAEARGERLEFSLLMTHAQDTLMVAMSEVMTARHIISLCKRVNDLESSLGEN